MPAAALGLALGAALLHALWNLLLARAADTMAATAVALLAAVVVFAPIAVVVHDVEAEAWPYLAVTASLQLVYFVLLTAAYDRAELSFVYPIARGAAPVLVLVAGVLLLGDEVTALQAVGVVVIAAGVLAVRGVRTAGRWRDLALALAVAGAIAAYTLLDKRGIRYADPITYLELSMIPATLGYLALACVRRGTTAVRRAIGPAAVGAGIASFAAYALVLAALERAPASSVSAVRETSIVIAAALALPMLGERVGWVRFTGAALVLAGVVLLAFQ